MNVKIKSVLKSFLKYSIIFSFLVNLGLFIILFTPINEITHKILLSNVPKIKFQESDSFDAVIICSSNFPFETDEGLPDLSTLVRLEKGIELYKKGIAKKVIAFGGIEIGKAKKTTGQAIKERLVLYGVPEKDIIVHDTVKGRWPYYENLLNMMYTYKDSIDFNKCIFVSSSDQIFRLYNCLRSEITNPIVITGQRYELYPDWGRRFHIFRRVVNEVLVAIPRFYYTGRFSVPSTFKWIKGNPNYHQ